MMPAISPACRSASSVTAAAQASSSGSSSGRSNPAGGCGPNTCSFNAPVNSECIPFTGSHTLIGANVSPWYPPRTVSIRVRPLLPRATWYWSASLIATSTETEPESQKNTCRNGSGVISTSRSASLMAGSWVSPPNITWLKSSTWLFTAASSTGLR